MTATDAKYLKNIITLWYQTQQGWLSPTERASVSAHFGLPWDNRGKCYMDGKRIQYLSNSSQHVSIYLQSFLVIQPVSSKVRHFSTFFAHFGLSWDNCGKCYTDGKRIQCWSNALQHIPIYLQPFTSYSEILVGNCNFFLPPCV